jgi:hypothetical protein
MTRAGIEPQEDDGEADEDEKQAEEHRAYVL